MGSKTTPADYAVGVCSEAEKKSKKMVEQLESGDFLEDLISMSGGSLEGMKEGWRTFYGQVNNSIEDFNTKRVEAANQLRATVTLAPSQTRGIDAKAVITKVGDFSVSTITSRNFDPTKLFDAAKKAGILERLQELSGINKDGKPYRLIEQQWDIDYEPLVAWLREHKYEDVIKAAYVESEGTPQVRGPKPRMLLFAEKPSK